MDEPDRHIPTPQELEEALRQSPRLRELAKRALDWLGGTLARIESEQRAAAPAAPQAPLKQVTLRLGGAEMPLAVPQAEPSAEALPTAPQRRATDVRVPLERAEGATLDLALVARRARLKEEACRWAVKRRQRMAEGVDFEQAVRPMDKELGRRVREIADCYAWPLDPYAKLPSDAKLDELAAGYESLAMAIDLVSEVSAVEKGRAFTELAYQLLAEAQSALRAGLLRYAEIDNDRDQDAVFQWLRDRTFREQIYVPRHMRLDDPADPGNWHDLQQRIEDLHVRFNEEGRLTRERKALFNRLRYHLDPDRARHEGGLEHWQRVHEAVGLLLASGLQPSNVELRDLLAPALERMPGDFQPSPGMALVLREIDRFQASREKESLAEEGPPSAPAEVVQNAARLLRGGRVVLIGGEERPRSRAALERALELSELCWITTSPGESYTSFEPEIARPETTLVILAIRWASHSYENVKRLCERHGKPYVRLPAGYSPNQVAEQVLRQASERLAARALNGR